MTRFRREHPEHPGHPGEAGPASRRLALLGGAGAALCAAGGLAWWAWPESDAWLAQVRRSGVLRVGYAVEPPYAELGLDQPPGGESPGVVQAAAQALGWRPVWTLTDFGLLLPQLEAGRFDVVAAGLFITPERRRRVRFSRPTLRVRGGWLWRTGAAAPPDDHVQAARLANQAAAGAGAPALRLVALSGSIEHQALLAAGLAPQRLLVAPDAATGETLVLRGQADALALSWPTVRRMAEASAGRLQARPIADAAASHEVALAMHRDASGLQHVLDGALQAFIGSAEHLALLQRCGLGPDDLPAADHERG